MPFWRVRVLAKSAEISASTRTRQIRSRVAIACATLFENLKCEKQSFSTFEIMPKEKKSFLSSF